ncbi:MAG: flagellar basal body P-ring formation chaperone FlgA [Pirellula sp.]
MTSEISNKSNLVSWAAYCVSLIGAVLLVSNYAHAQSNVNGNQSVSTIATLHIVTNVDTNANLIKLGDIAKINASADWQAKLAEIPLGASPIVGKPQILNRTDIGELLIRRGYNPAQFRWEGSSECRVTRVLQASTNRPSSSQSSSNQTTQDPNNFNRLASNQQTQYPSLAALGTGKPGGNTVPNRERFVPTNTSPALVTQAERVLAQAIANYLQTKADANVNWQVFPVVSPEIAPHIIQRRQILGVTGGEAPWDGEQVFELLLKGPQGEYTITVPATIQLPELVLASSKQLAKGHILRAEDLIHVPMPRNLKLETDEFFTKIDDLIGKELKRSMSTNQVIRTSEAGTQTLVQAGDAVKIVVQTAGIVVETHGRALGSGGQDELIPVEEADFKGRLTARVMGPREVQVISHGTTIQRTAKNKKNVPNRIQR